MGLPEHVSWRSESCFYLQGSAQSKHFLNVRLRVELLVKNHGSRPSKPVWPILNIYKASTFQGPVRSPGLADKCKSAFEDLHSRHHCSTLKYEVSGIFFFNSKGLAYNSFTWTLHLLHSGSQAL